MEAVAGLEPASTALQAAPSPLRHTATCSDHAPSGAAPPTRLERAPSGFEGRRPVPLDHGGMKLRTVHGARVELAQPKRAGYNRLISPMTRPMHGVNEGVRTLAITTRRAAVTPRPPLRPTTVGVSTEQESNLRPAVCKTAALPSELPVVVRAYRTDLVPLPGFEPGSSWSWHTRVFVARHAMNVNSESHSRDLRLCI